MEISTILRDAGINPRSSYYSGRGATLSDLDSQKLFKIQAQIKKHHGEDASTEFVKMVAAMPEMNATDFIENCFILQRCGFRWPATQASKNGFTIDRTPDGGHNEVQAMFAIAAAFGRGDWDYTEMIRGEFLATNGFHVSRGRDRWLN